MSIETGRQEDLALAGPEDGPTALSLDPSTHTALLTPDAALLAPDLEDPADLTREDIANPLVELSEPRERPPAVILTEQEAAQLSRQRSEREIFFHFLRHMRPYWRKAALVLLANIVVVTISVIPPWFGKYLIDDAFPNKNWGLFYGIFAAMIVMELFGRFIGTLTNIMNSYIRMRVALDLRRSSRDTGQ